MNNENGSGSGSSEAELIKKWAENFAQKAEVIRRVKTLARVLVDPAPLLGVPLTVDPPEAPIPFPVEQLEELVENLQLPGLSAAYKRVWDAQVDHFHARQALEEPDGFTPFRVQLAIDKGKDLAIQAASFQQYLAVLLQVIVSYQRAETSRLGNEWYETLKCLSGD